VLLAKLTFANARSESEWLVIRPKLPTTPFEHAESTSPNFTLW